MPQEAVMAPGWPVLWGWGLLVLWDSRSKAEPPLAQKGRGRRLLTHVHAPLPGAPLRQEAGPAGPDQPGLFSCIRPPLGSPGA